MHNLLLIIFIISLALVVHTYLIYPLGIMLFFSGREKKTDETPVKKEDAPPVAILIAAYNEEKVIGAKLRSVFDTGYPREKIRLYTGSDASSDRTDEIVLKMQQEFPEIELVRFQQRVGKIAIINHLQELAQESLLILTDANVLFTPNTIFELVKEFKNSRVGIVAGNIIKDSGSEEGISMPEKKYISLENRLKAGESNAFNLIMGAEGGCYALKKEYFTKVPEHFIVDDFFITLSVLNQNKFALFNPAAICREDVANDAAGEYRRKVRISSGNFQNLFFFKKNLLQFWKPIFFVFWSHKVLRWLTPFFLIICLIASALLMREQPVFIILFFLQLLGFLMPLLNYFLKFKAGFLKLISHFYLMNFALLEGFLKFTKGIKTSIWQPIGRNV